MLRDYRPETPEEYIGDPNLVENIRVYVKKKVPVILYGKPGVGKTSLVQLIGKLDGYHIIEYNASDERTKEKIKEIYRIAVTESLVKILILLDEADGSKASLSDVIKDTIHPVILTANKLWKIPKEIQDLCEKIEIRTRNLGEIVKRVKEIVEKEKLPPPDYSKITTDIRSSIISTIHGGQKYRPTDDVTFDIIRDLFREGKIEYLDKRKHLIWVLENADNFLSGRNLYDAIQLIAEADICNDMRILRSLPRGRGKKVSYPYIFKRKKALGVEGDEKPHR